MKKGPLITVVMPCYNAQNYVKAAVESILAQSFANFELIIIDDASTDESDAIIQRFTDERIDIHHHTERKGHYSCLNTGFKKARGKYICIMNADEVAMPERLAVQLSYIKRWKHAGCIGTGAAFIDNNGQTVGNYSFASDYSLIRAFLLKDKSMFNSSLMIRKSCIEKYNLEYEDETKSCPDYEFMVKCARLFPIRNIDECLIKKRIGSSVLDVSKNADQMIYANRIRLKLFEEFMIPMEDVMKRKFYLRLIKGDYLTDEELDEGINLLNEVLEKNKEIKLYDNHSLYQVFEDIIARAVKKNQLGGFSIEKKLLLFLNEKFPDGGNVLEFGSGEGTDALLKKYNVVSIEHDSVMAFERPGNHTCLYAPILDGWYDRDIVQKAITTKPDVILVDGPPRELRNGILNNLDLFNEIKVPLIFDDVNRQLDRDAMIGFCEKLNYNYEMIKGDEKIFAYCTKQ